VEMTPLMFTALLAVMLEHKAFRGQLKTLEK
jgi:hypothetical protein